MEGNACRAALCSDQFGVGLDLADDGFNGVSDASQIA